MVGMSEAGAISGRAIEPLADTPQYRDYRDLVIDGLADERSELHQAFTCAARDRDTFRLLAHVSLERLADLTLQNARLRQSIAKLVSEVRGKAPGAADKEVV
jgi:hypothetical protein